MKRALFIDFEDSFTYNVVQELTDLGLAVDLISWIDFEEETDHDLLVLGPGPGHPEDYQRIFPLIHSWIQKGKPFFGVCLGHQIFWTIKGEGVVKSIAPLHGQKVLLDLDQNWKSWLGISKEIYVQRYNSLTVKAPLRDKYPEIECFSLNEEVMISRGKGVITYQFHPESAGTSYRESFFAPILRDLV